MDKTSVFGTEDGGSIPSRGNENFGGRIGVEAVLRVASLIGKAGPS